MRNALRRNNVAKHAAQLVAGDSRLHQPGLDLDSRLQRSVDGTSLRDLQQFRPLLGAQRTCQFQFALNTIQNPFLRFALGAILGVNLRMPQAYDHALERPIFSPCIHSQSHGSARAQRREQQVVRRWSGVCAARSSGFIRGQMMRAGNNFLRKAHAVAAHNHARFQDRCTPRSLFRYVHATLRGAQRPISNTV